MIKSVHAKDHDSSYGGYPYKLVVTVELSVKEFNKACPISGRTRDYFGKSTVRRDLSALVGQVNYLINKDYNFPAYNPSIDSKGSKRASGGVKTMIFEYFFRDHALAESMGFELLKLKNGDIHTKYNQFIELTKAV